MLNEASLRGIRVVLVFANYWSQYGGVDQYNVWSFQAGTGALPCPAAASHTPRVQAALLFAHYWCKRPDEPVVAGCSLACMAGAQQRLCTGCSPLLDGPC